MNKATSSRSRRLAALILGVLFSALLGSCVMPVIEIGNPDFTLVKAGTWKGYYDASLVKAEVEVVATAGRVESVRVVEHDCSNKGKPAERIVDDIVAAQSLEVDVISGATDSSKCILKATELALIKGME